MTSSLVSCACVHVCACVWGGQFVWLYRSWMVYAFLYLRFLCKSRTTFHAAWRLQTWVLLGFWGANWIPSFCCPPGSHLDWLGSLVCIKISSIKFSVFWRDMNISFIWSLGLFTLFLTFCYWHFTRFIRLVLNPLYFTRSLKSFYSEFLKAKMAILSIKWVTGERFPGKAKDRDRYSVSLFFSQLNISPPGRKLYKWQTSIICSLPLLPEVLPTADFSNSSLVANNWRIYCFTLGWTDEHGARGRFGGLFYKPDLSTDVVGVVSPRDQILLYLKGTRLWVPLPPHLLRFLQKQRQGESKMLTLWCPSQLCWCLTYFWWCA